MIVRDATKKDIDLLVQVRSAFIEDEWGRRMDWDRDALLSDVRTYIHRHLGNDLFAVLAEIDGTVVASAFLVVSDRPPHPLFRSGRSATVLNVFTFPEYRRNGYATAVLRRLLDVAREQGVGRVDLSATPDGQPVYERLGFEPATYTEMKRTLGEQESGQD